MSILKKRALFEIKYEEDKILDYDKIFRNYNPVHLEIGSGRGEFILKKAAQNPQINFIAIDSKKKRIKTILRKLDGSLHPNVRVIRMFIDEKSIKIFGEKLIEKIYLIYSDPWPKRKHHRRRIIQTEFIKQLYSILNDKGMIELSTDHEGYAKWIISKFDKCNDFESFYKNQFTKKPESDHIETYFEKKKREEGFSPYFMKYRKVPK